MTVLQLVVLDVKPESLHDAGSCLCVYTQKASQPWIQFVLRGLIKEKYRDKANVGGKKEISSGKNLVTVEKVSGTWWSSMSRRVHLTFTSPGLLTWKPSVS